MPAAVPQKKAVKTDPELLRQISAASGGHEPLVGIFRLRPEDSTKLTNSPDRTEKIVQEVFDRVAKKVGTTVDRLNILRNLGMVVVSAVPTFLSELLKQPEIYSAMANQPSGGGKIEPINKRVVPESAINKSTNSKTSGASKSVVSRKASVKKASRKR
jgi:hypothetical protein